MKTNSSNRFTLYLSVTSCWASFYLASDILVFTNLFDVCHCVQVGKLKLKECERLMKEHTWQRVAQRCRLLPENTLFPWHSRQPLFSTVASSRCNSFQCEISLWENGSQSEQLVQVHAFTERSTQEPHRDLLE